jgi:hypothetical protein
MHSRYGLVNFDGNLRRMQQCIVNQATAHRGFYAGPVLRSKLSGSLDGDEKIVNARWILKLLGSYVDPGTLSCDFIFPQILCGVESSARAQ